MMRYGLRFVVELFGTSHGPCVGVQVEGVPPGHHVDVSQVQAELDRRSPSRRRLATRRREDDRLVVDRGWPDDTSDGGAFRAHVANEDVDRAPYERLHDVPRPGHADYPARVRYGPEADLSGGGIFSGRMTVGLVIAGAIARQILEPVGIDIVAFTRRIGPVELAEVPRGSVPEVRASASANEVGCPDPSTAQRMEECIERTRREGDSLGGVIEIRADGVPVGLGEPFFGSLESLLAASALSVPAVKGVEFGDGFSAAGMRGSEHNDGYRMSGGRVVLESNHAGGILGGLANGASLVYRVVVKPTSSIARPQRSVNLVTGAPVDLVVPGRHDPCIVPRAVVVLEATTAISLLDLALLGGFVT